MKITETAKTVLETRYFLKDDDGKINEDWDKLTSRVGYYIAKDDKKLGKKFKNIIHDMDFLPNSPCLMNAGIELGQLSACFVIPVEDNMPSIFKAVSDAALINKSGGGVGYSFSDLREANSTVLSTQGVASGPLSFIKVFDVSTDVIKQGGRRRGANMAVLKITHPDIKSFINAKEVDGDFSNFNFSIAITDDFMKKVQNDETFWTISPHSGNAVEELSAKEIWQLLVDKAWIGGDPGVLFIDAANRANAIPHMGDLEATNPCGEQWLLPYESCNLGSINLNNFIQDGIIDWEKLDEVTRLATRFLNNVIDLNKFPIPEIEEMTLKTRKIGLGIMGLHDMLIQLELPYDSDEARDISGEIMSFVEKVSKDESEFIATETGSFPAYDDSCNYTPRANAATTSIQPTGTVSMIADCSSGCEPYYSVITEKHVMDGEKLIMVNTHFEIVAKREGFYSEELIEEIAKKGTVVGNKKVPKKWQKIFVGAMDVSPEGHLKMQATLQNNGVDSSISKTVNMPNSATIDDVENIYRTAWELGCKGVTIYRDGSKSMQVLNTGTKPTVFDRPDCINYTMSPVRPKKLPVDIFHSSVKGKPWVVLIGLLNDRPFEIFAGELDDLYIPKSCKTGFVEKIGENGDSTYALTIKIRQQEVVYKQIAHTLMNSEQKALTRMISLSLRHGVHYEFIVNQLKKSSGEITDFAAVVNRILSKYIKQYEFTPDKFCLECGGKIAFIEGCEKCLSCGTSKCG